MSAGYDGNIKLGVSVTADSKSVVAELGALRKQIVDMFSSVDKSLAGGSGSFSNLEKSLSKIATDVGNISKVINGLPTSQVAKVVDMVKEVGTAAQQSGDAIKSAFDFNAETASTEELYQKLKQLRAEADAIKQQMLAEGFSPVQANNSKDVRIRENQASAIADELRNRGLSDKNDYMPATNFSGDIGDMQVKNLEDALKQAYEALYELQSGLSSMNEDDAGFAEKTARVNELTQAIANLNEQLGFEKARISGVSASTDGANPKTQTVSSHNMGYDVSGIKYIEIASAQGKEAAEAFINQYNEVLNSQGREAADAFAKSFNVVSGSGDSMIAQYKQELAELQSKMKDFDKLKITMSDEEVGKTLNRIDELKVKLAELTKDAKFFTLDVPVDDGLRDSMMAMQELQSKMRQFQQTGTGFGSMEEAQTASVRIADLSKAIQDYFRNLDPAVQKLNDYRQALADVGTAEASMKSGKELTAEEAAQYEAASAKVKEYANDLGSLIQIRNALKAQVGQFEKTGVGMNNAELEQSKTLLSELNARINQLNGNQPKFDMTISNQSIVDAKRNLDELIAKKKQMEAQGMGRGYAEYDALCAQLDRARQRYDSLTDASNRATTAMSGIQKANSALNRIGSTISRLLKHVGSLITSFRRLGSVGSLAGLDISKGFKRGFTTFLKYGLGIRSIFMLFRRLRSSAVSAFDAMAQSDGGLNAELAHTKELMQNFKLSIGTAVQPLVSALLPAINAIIAALTRALTAIGTFFAALTGQGYIYKATASGIAGVGGAAKKAKADLMGFDELNKLSDDNDGGGGGGGGGGFKKVPIDPNSAIAKFAEMIKKAWETGNFFDVGAFLGEKLKEGLEKVNTWITTEGFALAKKLGNSFATLINGFISVEGLPETIGKTVGNAINMGLIGVYQFLEVTDWIGVGKFIADAIMSGFKTVDWELLGRTAGSYIMMFVDTMWSFVTNLDFDKMGSSIATAINNFISRIGEVDETGLSGWQKMGQSISRAFTGIGDMIITALREVDWHQIGVAIGEFISSIDWGKLVIDFAGLVGAILSGIAEAFAGWAGENPISAAICGVIVAAIAGIKIASILLAVNGFIDKLLPQLSSLFSKFGVSKKLGESAASGGSVVGEINAAGDTVSQVDTSVTTLTSKLTTLVKNLALGLVVILEVVAAVAIVVAAIWALGLGLTQIGEAWQPVLDNGETIIAALAFGTGILAAVGVATALLGSVGKTLIINIALGIAMLAEIGVATGLFVAEIWAMGLALEQIGIAWQPVLANGGTITQAILIGTGILIAVGAATALLGTAAVASAGALPIAIGLGTAMLVELGIATAVFITEIVKIGEILVEVIDAWQPVLNNGKTVEDAIKKGTELLLAIGVVTAALGTLTVASAGLLPLAIDLGTKMLSKLSDSFSKFTDELIILAKKLGDELYPELVKLNSKLPTLSRCMENYKDFMKDFAGYVVEFSGDSIISGISNTVSKIVGFFTGDPITQLAKQVRDQYEKTTKLITELQLAVPALEEAIQWLQQYKEAVEALKFEASNTELTSIIQLSVSVESVQGLFSEVIATVDTAWQTIVESTTLAWTTVGTFLDTVWLNMGTTILTTLNTIGVTVSTSFTTLSVKINTIWLQIRTTITSILTTIKSTFTTTFNAIKSTVTTTLTTLKTTLNYDMTSMKSNISSAMSSIKSTFMSSWNSIRSGVVGIANGMRSSISGVMSGISSAVIGAAGSVRTAINIIIRALNGLHFSIPSWVPGWGGRSWHMNIPYLAQGAVIPPNKEFMAVLGDQKHGTNIEAPLDTIKQAVAEELSDYIDAMMAGFEAVVSAIDNKDMDVTIGDTDIGQAAERYNNRQKLVRGTT